MVDKKREPLQPTLLGNLARQCGEDSDRWFGDMNAHNIAHHSLGLAGEVGEFCNIVKKIDRGSLDIRDASTRYQLMMELTDAFVYTLNLADLLHIDLGHSYAHVRGLNEKRFMEERERRTSNGRPVADRPQA